MKKKLTILITALALAMCCLLAGCGSTQTSSATISLNGDSATVTGSGAAADGSKVTISSPGTYEVTGTLTDGQLVVNTDGAVTINLNNASITNTEDDAIHVKSGTVTVNLADGTQNTLTSGTESADTTTLRFRQFRQHLRQHRHKHYFPAADHGRDGLRNGGHDHDHDNYRGK
jgi:uncharacterized lipoprotein YmbA